MSIKSNISKYFEEHPNEKIYLGDIAGELGLTDLQTQSAIYQLRKDGFDLEVVHIGQCWLYVPPVATDDKLQMPVVGTTKKGSRILEDENGDLWIARKFEAE